MDAYRFHLKFDFAPEAELDFDRLIPIFHRWIQQGRLDELLIDVADYRHVPEGPGVMLITHEAHYGVELADGRLGLIYARKRPAGGSFADRLRHALDRLLAAGVALEQEAALAGLSLPGDRWTLSLQDRLLAPNDESTREVVEPEFRQLLDGLYGAEGFELQAEQDPAECFGLRVRAHEAPGLAELRWRLAKQTQATPSPKPTPIATTELHLPLELRDELKQRVGEGYPRETCGLLIGRPGDQRLEVERLVEARNLDRSEAGDRYQLDPQDFVAADNAARQEGLDILGIWHSHPDCPARPSTTDLEAAWEGYSYLIVGVTETGDVDFHSWRLTGDRFAKEQILPQPDPSQAPALQFHRPLKEERAS